jgi:hypothetical protein
MAIAHGESATAIRSASAAIWLNVEAVPHRPQ